MSVTSIYEVRQRDTDTILNRELGIFPDENMAKHAIDQCYRELWSVISAHPFVSNEWVSDRYISETDTSSFERWYDANIAGPLPLFYSVQHFYHSNVPINMLGFGVLLPSTVAVVW